MTKLAEKKKQKVIEVELPTQEEIVAVLKYFQPLSNMAENEITSSTQKKFVKPTKEEFYQLIQNATNYKPLLEKHQQLKNDNQQLIDDYQELQNDYQRLKENNKRNAGRKHATTAETRKDIISMYHDDQMTMQQIAKHINVSFGVVQGIIKNHKEQAT